MQEEGAKLVNREGGGGGLDLDDGNNLTLGERAVELNYGGEEKKKAERTASGKKKAKKGAFGPGGRNAERAGAPSSRARARGPPARSFETETETERRRQRQRDAERQSF